MPTVSIIAPGTRGIDGKADPLTLGTRKLAHAVNLSFQEGSIKTRPGIYYRPLGINGQFQGSTLFCPSLGLSVRSFGHSGAQIATAVSGGIYLNSVTPTAVSCTAVKLEGTEEGECEPADVRCRGDVNLFQAENYLIIHNRNGSTFWWTGEGALVRSPGMSTDLSQGGEDTHSHDTFISANHTNWLVNAAGLGAYAHGRVHQEAGNRIYVSDIIHKRGVLQTGDILLMEEQSLASCGPPLSTNSKMGMLVALELSPQMTTPNGEGQLVAYYEGGVVTYNTALAPRESRYDPKTNQFITKGWDQQRLVDHRLNSVSATGRYAVAVLPRDQLFRSPFGVHLLSQVIGTETISDEPANTISKEIEPILLQDDPDAVYGAACGYWLRGQRYFVTTGLTFSEAHSSSPCARGFLSWNKVFTKTQDRTPIPAWEGVWTIDAGMAGIHRFTHIGLRQDEGGYGFLCSDTDKNLYFGHILDDCAEDNRNGVDVPIPWAFETGRFAFSSLSTLKRITDARLEGVFGQSCVRVKIYLRTDRRPVWARWREFPPCPRKLEIGQRLLRAEPLGQPPEGYQEAAWFEFRVEGVGYAEIRTFDVDVSESKSSAGTSLSVVVDCIKKNYLSAQI